MAWTSLGCAFVLIISMAPGPFPWKKRKGKETSYSSTSAAIEEADEETISVDVPSTSAQERPLPTVDTQSSLETRFEAGPSLTKRRRGKTRGIALEKLNTAMGQKITIEIDPYNGRPTDKVKARHFQTLIGIAAREDAPVEGDFRLISNERLRGCYDRIEAHANVVGMRTVPQVLAAINRRLSKQIRENRYRLKKKYDKIGDAAKPYWWSIEQWERQKKYWEATNFIEKSKKNQHTRVNFVKNYHTSGATSFAVRRKEISDNELGGGPCGPILLYYRTHCRIDDKGVEHWGSDSGKDIYSEMVTTRDKALSAGITFDEEAIVNKVLKNGYRADYQYGWGYGHIPERTEGKKERVSKVDLEAAIRAAEESINLEWQKKFQEQEERQKMMERQMQQMNNLIHEMMKAQNGAPFENPGSSQPSTSAMLSSSTKRRVYAHEIEDESEEEEGSTDEESDEESDE